MASPYRCTPGEVVLVAPGGSFGRGGIATVTLTLSQELSKQVGWNVVVVDSRGIGSAWLSPLYCVLAAVAIVKTRLLRGTRLMHLQVSERSSFVRKGLLLLLGHKLGMAVVLHHHGAELIPYYNGASSVMRAWTKQVVRWADVNVVLGKRWESFLCDELGVDRGKVRLLYNASADLKADVSSARERHRTFAKENERFRILVMAHLAPRKGIGEMLAASLLLVNRGLAIQVTFAGTGDLERYRREAELLGLSDFVQFLGWVERSEVPRLLAFADALALPSFEEGLPMAILEALSCGVPVVATRVGSIGELLTSEQDCILVPSGNAEALADALHRLAAGSNLCLTLAGNGRKLFDENFEIHRYCKNLAEIYAEALNARFVD